MSQDPKSQGANAPRAKASPRTATELRAYADDLEARAHADAQRLLDERMAEVRRVRDAADVVERLDRMTTARRENIAAGGGDVVPLPHAPGSNSDLRPRADNAYIAGMGQAQIEVSSSRPRGAPLKSGGPVARVAKILGVSGADVAWLLNVNYQTSRAWDGADRRVPDDIAPRLEGLVASKKAIAENLRKLADRPKPTKSAKKNAK